MCQILWKNKKTSSCLVWLKTLLCHLLDNKTRPITNFSKKKLLVFCPAKCSYSVRLGKHTPGKTRPIKLMSKTPVGQDTACFFLMSNTASIKATNFLFKVSHDHTTIEVMEKRSTMP